MRKTSEPEKHLTWLFLCPPLSSQPTAGLERNRSDSITCYLRASQEFKDDVKNPMQAAPNKPQRDCILAGHTGQLCDLKAVTTPLPTATPSHPSPFQVLFAGMYTGPTVLDTTPECGLAWCRLLPGNVESMRISHNSPWCCSLPGRQQGPPPCRENFPGMSLPVPHRLS